MIAEPNLYERLNVPTCSQSKRLTPRRLAQPGEAVDDSDKELNAGDRQGRAPDPTGGLRVSGGNHQGEKENAMCRGWWGEKNGR